MINLTFIACIVVYVMQVLELFLNTKNSLLHILRKTKYKYLN